MIQLRVLGRPYWHSAFGLRPIQQTLDTQLGQNEISCLMTLSLNKKYHIIVQCKCQFEEGYILYRRVTNLIIMHYLLTKIGGMLLLKFLDVYSLIILDCNLSYEAWNLVSKVLCFHQLNAAFAM